MSTKTSAGRPRGGAPRSDRGVREGFRKRLTEVIRERYSGVRSGLARALEKSPSQVNKYFNDKYKTLPSAGELLRISHVTGYSIDWLLTGQLPRRRGGTPTGGALAAQLRAYLIEDSYMSDMLVSGIEVAESASEGGAALHNEVSTLPIANLLPETDDRLLLDTAILWYGASQTLADAIVAGHAFERLVRGQPGVRVSRAKRERFFTAYRLAQGAARQQSTADSDVRFTAAAIVAGR